MPYTLANDNMSIVYLTGLVHGQVVYGLLKCLNKVELAAVAASSALVAAYEKPDIAMAEVKLISDAYVRFPMSGLPDKFHIIANNGSFAFNDQIFVQGNLTTLKFEWAGITDAAGLRNYEYRVMVADGVIVNWTYCGNYTFVDVPLVRLTSETIYAVQIRATNMAGFTSDAIQAFAYGKGSVPKLTGNAFLYFILFAF
ncbi:hypothetical protein DPMN_068359 [Dreissena polymorpha]|uniref:Fibronectin type-III domain-containing protein n=1 Tax=Dreissena polymorpha TaxID=45954 RepID=A0A9D3YX07_DREPO|nr:hypothetical protein DPMN_068359 [Dreissena polymorpha]